MNTTIDNDDKLIINKNNVKYFSPPNSGRSTPSNFINRSNISVNKTPYHPQQQQQQQQHQLQQQIFMNKYQTAPKFNE